MTFKASQFLDDKSSGAFLITVSDKRFL